MTPQSTQGELPAERMAAADALALWLSAHIPSDEFMLYAFGGAPGDLDEIVAGLRRRAAACPDLARRVADDCRLRYPRWVSGPISDDQFVRHDADLDWPGCLTAVAALVDRQLDPTRAAWRLHIFDAVRAVPGAEVATVVVLQLVHALADGSRAADLAGRLFGRDRPVAPVAAMPSGNLVLRGLAAARAQRRFDADIAAGTLPGPAAVRPLLPTNAVPAGVHRIRTLVCERRRLPEGISVTVAVLTGIGTALAAHLAARGADPERLGAEVPMADAGIRHARNYFHNVGIELRPELPVAARASDIAGQLRGARERAEHPAAEAQRRATAAVPAPLLRWGVAQFDPTVRAPAVTGNTVVSSVNRGPADLTFGVARVVFTAGYPALSPMMALTHGVHGIGGTIAISVHAAESALDADQLDDYVTRLAAALGTDGPPTRPAT